MSYRNITVMGRQYQFTIGHTFTRVRDDKGKATLYRNDEWGLPISDQLSQRDASGMRITRPCRDEKGRFLTVVSPKVVAAMIRGEKPTRFNPIPCPHHPDEFITGKSFNPFESEIYNRRTLMNNCYQCVDEVAQDI